MAASSTGTSSSRPPAHVSEGWKHGGLLKVQGIPSPTGSMEVGCVDVMHRFPDDDRGLLVRLFYPTQPGLAGTHQYARWTPNHRYIKGYLDYLQRKWTFFVSILARLLTCKCWCNKYMHLYSTRLVKWPCMLHSVNKTCHHTLHINDIVLVGTTVRDVHTCKSKS